MYLCRGTDIYTGPKWIRTFGGRLQARGGNNFSPAGSFGFLHPSGELSPGGPLRKVNTPYGKLSVIAEVANGQTSKRLKTNAIYYKDVSQDKGNQLNTPSRFAVSNFA